MTLKETNEIIEKNFHIMLNSNKHPDHFGDLATVLGCSRTDAKVHFYRYMWERVGHVQHLFADTLTSLDQLLSAQSV